MNAPIQKELRTSTMRSLYLVVTLLAVCLLVSPVMADVNPDAGSTTADVRSASDAASNSGPETKPTPEPRVEKPAPARASVEPAQEKVPGGRLMLIAYLFIWLIPLFLLWKATWETARLERRLEDMEELVREAAETKP